MNQPLPGQRGDWVVDRRSWTLAWGLPTAALLLAVFLEPNARTITWTASLIWMGAACLANAKRCGRTHCYFTGPFFLVMALATLLHGLGVMGLGPNGWIWLGVAIAVGGYGAFWYLPERIWGKFRDRDHR
jgi:hypothetical protein